MSGQDSGNTRYRIIYSLQQYVQDDSAVLAIGLGGTGIDCLRILKAKVYERLRPDNPGGVVPHYEHVKFLAVDTDAADMKKKANDASSGILGRLDLSEFFDISCSSKLSNLFSKQRNNLARDPAYREWLQFDGGINFGAATNGAGGIRQVGRYLLMRRASQFVSTVKSLVNQITKNSTASARGVYVHIFSGLGGGTGSGTFLDACYLVREALHRANIQDNKIMGYFFLPDVSANKDGVSGAVQSYIELNGFAAMQELDYCMGFGRNGDAWHQVYPGMNNIEWSTPPVDLCHLVAGRTEKGGTHSDAYVHAMNVVGDYVMDFLARPADDAFSLTSHLDNVETIKQATQGSQAHGASYDYLVLGASSAIVPYGRTMAYLASGFFQRLGGLGIRGRVPTEKEVEQFQEDVGLTHDALLKELQSGVVVDPDKFDATPADALKKRPNVESHYMALEADAKGNIDQNFSDLSRGVPDHVRTELPTDGKAQAVMAKVVNAVLDAMADPERGPWYASALVRSEKGTDLIAAVDGIRGKAAEERVQEASQEAVGMPIGDGFARARDEFFGCSRFLKPLLLKKKYDAFVEATCELTRCHIRRDSYEALENLAKALIPQLDLLADKLTVPFEKAVGRLLNTFNAWWTHLQNFADDSNPYEEPIVTMKQIAPILNKALDKYGVNRVARGLLSTLLDKGGRAAWGSEGDDALLTHLVSDYLVRTFDDWSGRSLENYLEDRYDVHNNPQQLALRVQSDLLKNMGSQAEVLFDVAMGYDLPDSSILCYVTVPQNSSVVVSAAKGYAAAQGAGYNVRETAVTDRVSLLRLKVGVPLWGYGNTESYENRYVPKPGRHLYEKAVYVDGASAPGVVEASRNWGLLPSPVPRSRMSAGTKPEVRDRADKAAAIFGEALQEGVIVRDADKYTIHTISESFMQGVRAIHDAAKGLPVVDKLKEQAKLQAMDSNRAYDPKEFLLSDMLRPNDDMVEQTICVDLLAKAPVLEVIVRKELAKCREIAGCIEDLAPKDDPDLNSFRNALFTGVIEFSNPVVRYVDGGLNGSIILSDRSFDHGTIPLYQAFLSFKDKSVLVPAMRKAIDAQTQSILTANQIPGGVQEACNAVQSELNRGLNLIAIATMKFPRKVNEVKELLDNLTKELTVFKLEYQISDGNPSTV